MYVNYVREREAFYEWLTFNSLSTSAQSLWNALFTIFNAKGWPDGFVKVPDIMLRSYMHVSHDAILDARAQLKNKGLLDFIKGERRVQAAAYKLTFFTVEQGVCAEKAGNGADKPADNTAGKQAGNPTDNAPDKGADTNKLNLAVNVNVNQRVCDDEEEEDAAFSRAMRAMAETVQSSFVQHFGRKPKPAEANHIALMAVHFELGSIIDEAVKRAANLGANNPAPYIAKICEEWHYERITTPEELGEYDFLRDSADRRTHFGMDASEALRLIREKREERVQRRQTQP